MHRSVTAAALLLSSVAVAQPSVPAGFTARLIAPLLDGQVPQLSAIESLNLGKGVVTASTTNGISTFRRLSPTGTITTLGTYTNAATEYVSRVQFDSENVLGFEVYATVIDIIADDLTGPPAGHISHFVVLDLNDEFQSLWQSGSFTEQRGYDFAITSGLAGNPTGLVLLDSDGTHGTSLAITSLDGSPTETNDNSVPLGRTDTDVVGLSTDVTGLYGGGVLIADTDINTDALSAIYEVRDAVVGGSYRLIGSASSTNARRYGDLGIAAAGPFGGVVYVTETLTNEIQQVAPDGTHTTWATGFVGIDSLSISPDGESMYVADLNGVWLIRPEGNEPGPAVLATDPSASGGTQLCGSPVNALRVIFTEPVSFDDGDVTITNSDGQPVGFDASGSGSQFMIIGLATPLSGDTYTVTIADTLTSATTGQPLDGDNDGVAGTDAVLIFTHACEGDIADDFGTPGGDGMVSFGDFLRMLAIVGACP